MGTPAEATFPGFSLDSQLGRIKQMIKRTDAQVVLDYGCGKGKQYEQRLLKDENARTWTSVLDYWEIDEIVCYDPCYEPHSALPIGKFDGVISTDVLEHCPEDDMPWILEEIFGYATRFVFANVACYPARKRLPSGENAHCTIKPVEWWQALLHDIAVRHPGTQWEFWFQSQIDAPDGKRTIEQRISG